MAYAVIDFETEGIEHRPSYPPVPVGVAIKVGSSCRYYAWGHPTANNATRRDALRALKAVWSSHELIFHNAAFDIEVAMAHFNLPWPQRYHDTLILAYLHDPRDPSFSLKPLAEKYLDMPPEEQDAVKDWVIDCYLKPRGIRKVKGWGAFIAKAPGELVGTYAKGDVHRTWKLFKVFYDHIHHPVEGSDRNMVAAYQRELRLLRTKIHMETGGIRGDTKKLAQDIPKFQACLDDVEGKIRRKLKISKRWEREYCPGGKFNVNSGKQLAAAIERVGLIPEDRWIWTDKGNKSTSRVNLEKCLTDASLIRLLGFQGILSNYLSTFMRPWLESCQSYDGYIYPSFNTVRGLEQFGTKTGRLSSSNPNFQNIPASVKGSNHEHILLPLQKLLQTKYKVPLVGLRDYLLPDEGYVFLNRDYSQQEFRILAHYEDGGLLHRYQDNPTIDAHDLVQAMVKDATGREYPRKSIKNVNFGIVYGMGAAALAGRIGCSEDEARELKKLILKQIPGIDDLSRSLKKMASNNEPLITYGDRFYYCEPDAWIKGRGWVDFAYKMLNLLIQGSAADCTKQAMIQVQDNMGVDSRIVLQVHDELMMSVPRREAKVEMNRMREAMEDMQFDIPMLTDGKWGLSGESWARLEKAA